MIDPYPLIDVTAYANNAFSNISDHEIILAMVESCFKEQSLSLHSRITISSTALQKSQELEEEERADVLVKIHFGLGDYICLNSEELDSLDAKDLKQLASNIIDCIDTTLLKEEHFNTYVSHLTFPRSSKVQDGPKKALKHIERISKLNCTVEEQKEVLKLTDKEYTNKWRLIMESLLFSM